MAHVFEKTSGVEFKVFHFPSCRRRVMSSVRERSKPDLRFEMELRDAF